MRLLIITSTLDLSKPYGATPALWQLFKGFYEEGHELFIIPYSGRAIDTIWWKSYPNSNYYKSSILESIIQRTGNRRSIRNSSLVPIFARVLAMPNLQKTVSRILESEDIDAMMLIGLPLNQLNGFVARIKRKRSIPTVYYDLDVPTSLPSNGGFTFDYYNGADLSEYDAFIIPSEGSIQELREMGVNRVSVVHFGVDPDVYTPIESKKDIDLFFFGNGGQTRKKNIEMMITEPSRRLNNKFVVSGRGLNVEMGNAVTIDPLSFTTWRKYCSRSKINLNVVRDLHARVHATSSSRPFELAAMQSCIVSAPYSGIENWFDIGKEIMIVHSVAECIETYQALLDDPVKREEMGKAARARIIKEHTSRHRAKQIAELLAKFC